MNMHTLSKDSKGAGVLVLQKALTAAGFSTTADGVFGDYTLHKVEAFQTAKGLKSDGVVGEKTWEALGVKAPHYLMGVDVSHWHANFDFEKGVKDGVVFMMTKASESRSADHTCASECDKATKAGVKYKGAYHFFHASIPVADQVAVYLKQLKHLTLEMPCILDLEETSMDGQSHAHVKDTALDWLTQIEAKTGKVPLLYVDMNLVTILGLNHDARFNKYPRWIAKYSKTEPPVAWTFWQFTDKGEQGADTDWFHGTEDDLKKFLGVV
jgi:lysozyme